MAKWGVNKVCLVESVSERKDRRWQHCSVHQHMSQHILSDLLTHRVRCLSECCEVSPGERQPVSRLWLIILLPGAIRSHRWKTVGPHAQEETFPKFDACLPDDVLLPLSELQLLLFYRDAEKHQHYCTSLVNPRVVGSGYALWLQVGGQFGLRIAAEQLSKLWKGCHQLSCGTLSTTQMWSNISKRPCEAKKNAPPWNVIHARGVFSYWFLVQTGIQVGVSGIRKQKRWCGVKVCSDGAG